MQKSKFLFLIPPYFKAEDFIAENKFQALPAFTVPYGIVSMISYLSDRVDDWDFDVVDLNIVLRDCIEECRFDYDAAFEEQISAALKRGESTKIVGLSALFNSSFDYIQKLSSFVKSLDPSVYVMTGGGLPSAAYDKILQVCDSVDAVCKGEGEVPLERVLNTPDWWSAISRDESFATRASIEAGKVPVHSFIWDLDEIPPMKFDVVDLNNYNARSLDKRFAAAEGKRELTIHTSRGCPFKCVFCSNPSLHGYDVRKMSVDRVEKEVTRMKNEFGMNVLLIEDDHFFADIPRAKEILRRLEPMNLRVEFPNGLAVYAIDEEVAGLLARAGVSVCALAVESGSDYVLAKLMKKPLKAKKVIPAVNHLQNAGINVHAFIVAGIPGETDEHREETRELLIEAGFDWVHIFCAIPIFGSRLYEICAENGYITVEEDPAKFVNSQSIIRTESIDPDKLQKWVYRTQIEVNFLHNGNIRKGNPERALPYLLNVIDKYPEHPFGHYGLALVNKAMGNSDEGKANIDKAIDIFNRDSDWGLLAGELGLDLKTEETVT